MIQIVCCDACHQPVHITTGSPAVQAWEDGRGRYYHFACYTPSTPAVPEAEPQEQEEDSPLELAIDAYRLIAIGQEREFREGKLSLAWKDDLGQAKQAIIAAAHREYAQPTTLKEHLAGIPQGAIIQRVEHGIKWHMPDSAAQPGKGV